MTSPSDQALQPQINPYAPPEMKTLIYSPGVKIYIVHNGVQYDVSADLVRGQVVKNENSASSLFFTLTNKPLVPGGQGRYNAGEPFAFSRMDTVTVYLKRFGQYKQVFTGFLDTIPYKQIYPGTVDFRATCTLKKLMHTWWNPALPANQELLSQRNFGQMVGGDGQLPVDSGLGGMLRNLLVKVGGWQDNQVYIQNFPLNFFPFVLDYIARNQEGNNNLAETFKTLILGPDHGASPGASAGYNPSAPLGAWPPMGAGVAGQGQVTYLPFIVAACDARGMGPQTANVQQAQNTQLAGESGAASNTGPSLGNNDSAAWQQVANQGQNSVIQENLSDAAILAVACILVESQWRNYTNPTVPQSSTFPNDGPPPIPNLDSVGLFQQRSNWGTIAQRMNPYSAAGMFYDKLNEFGWRNMEPGAAIFKVQIGASPALYSAQVPAATAIVKAYREAQAKGTSTVVGAATSAVPLASSVASSVANSINNSINTAGVGSPASTGAGPVGGNLRIGKPVPDSEGAINAATAMMLTPYKAGGRTPYKELDAPGLINWAFRCIGKDAGDTVGALGNNPKVNPTTLAQRGDIIQTSTGGVGLYLGANMWITTGGADKTPGRIEPLPEPLNLVARVMRVCENGGIDPAAPFTPPILGMPRGTPSGTGDSGSRGAQGSPSEPIARNLFSYQFEPDTYAGAMAGLYFGEKAYIDAQPLIQIVQAIARAGLRSFQSAPNGDFIAYTSDEFGLYGKPAVLDLEDIEIKDCIINLSDDPLTTHVYIEGSLDMTGQVDQELGWITTFGVATVENKALFNQLRKIAPGDMVGMTGEEITSKFGVRPFKQTYQLAGSPALEFLLATQTFMGKWSAMYETRMALTFMPELFPGMRVRLVQHNMQLYCSQVTHIFDWEQGFSTFARLSSVSSPNSAIAITGGSTPISQWYWPSDNQFFGGGTGTNTLTPTTPTIDGTGATSTVVVPGDNS